jgi:hypothetical protein
MGILCILTILRSVCVKRRSITTSDFQINRDASDAPLRITCQIGPARPSMPDRDRADRSCMTSAASGHGSQASDAGGKHTGQEQQVTPDRRLIPVR